MFLKEAMQLKSPDILTHTKARKYIDISSKVPRNDFHKHMATWNTKADKHTGK